MASRTLKYFFCVAILLAALSAGAFQESRRNRESCALVMQALADAQQLRPGMKRGEVPKTFVQQDGMNFRDHTYYVYRGCRSIKVEVNFDLDPNVAQEFSASDIVKTVSKPYLEYPIRD